MSIGVPARGLTPPGLPIKIAADRGAIIYPTIADAIADGNTVIQGGEKAVAPMADIVTGRIAPDIPGGLQMQMVVIALPAQPEVLPEPVPGVVAPAPGLDHLTDGAGNYLTDGAGFYLTT